MDLFDAAPPRLSPEGAERLAREVFGVSGVVESLPSERDRNFLIRAATTGVLP